MSDELLDGRSMRHRPRRRRDDDDTTSKRPPVDEDARKRRKKREKLLDEDPFALDPPTGTHPYVNLEPPEDGVIEKPVVEAGEPDEAEAQTSQAAPNTPAPAEPHSQPIMKLPRIREDEADDAAHEDAQSPPPASDQPAPQRPGYVPHFHTPTKVYPPVPDLGNAAPAEPPSEAASAAQPRPDYVPHFHTPTGEMPPVPDEEPPAPRPDKTEISSTTQSRKRSRLEEYMPHFHTPTEEVPPVPREDEPDPMVLGGHTPQILRPIEDEDFDEDEQPAASPPPPSVEAPVVKVGGQRQTATPARGLRIPTPDIELPPSEVEIDPDTGEVVDAEWILEVGSRMRSAQAQGEPARLSADKIPFDRSSAGRLPRTRTLDEPSSLVIALKKNSKWLVPLVAVTIILALALIVPPSLSRLSGDGSSRLMSAGASLATVTPGGRSLPAVEPTPTAIPATFTPLPPYAQGYVVFVKGSGGNNDIAVLTMATREVTNLTNDPADDRDPVWSPDGRRIVFVSNRSGTYDLWVMNADGSNPAAITNSADDDRSPAWSPDGSTLLFSRESVLGATLTAVDTTCLSMPATCEGRIRPITTEHYDRFPAWAPGGGQIAFTTGDYAGDETTAIAIMDLDGSNYTVVTGTGASDSHPVWSPDGMRIAFVSNANRDEDLWIVGRSGDNLVQLTQDAALDVAPSWSPDGTLIVFASDRAGNFDLYLIRTDCAAPDGGCEAGIMQLTTDPDDEFDPAWTH